MQCGDRVRLKLEIEDGFPNGLMGGSLGTVDEVDRVPYVIWDNFGRWAVHQDLLELIEEQTDIENMTIEDFLKQQIEELKIELANKQSRIDWLEGNLAAYKEVLGIGGNNHE